jgi:hypothetical protein
MPHHDPRGGIRALAKQHPGAVNQRLRRPSNHEPAVYPAVEELAPA